ncbi:MAG: sigma-54-dependent Fis family transcriptional regulator [Myxococcales bacterium]|nr:sigma-54-dependent Fis family transcriptional regulator [Myxococcales bacterium]
MKKPRVLVADDKDTILGLFGRILSDRFEVVTATDGQRALALALNDEFDVVVSDIRMPGADGFTVLRELKRAKPEVEIVLMTAFGSVEKAVEAMKEGAYDYLAKPFDPDEALLTIERAVERKRLREQARDLSAALGNIAHFDRLVGKSAAMQQLFELLERAAGSDATVLITGESGTGKELAARAVHAKSARKSGRFVAVNCGAIPETLIEAELFGHVKGAFTGAVGDRRGLFEEAHGGTLLLDEVGDLPLSMQVKLTRVLQEHSVRRVGESQERRVDVRVVAATNADLKAAVGAGRFREDLFYRLNVFPVRLPPLRERREDIPVLAAHFVDRHRGRYGGGVDGFAPEALSALVRHDWPGNVRELENAIERALAVIDGPRIPLEALPEEIAAQGRPRLAGDLGRLTYREVVDIARDRVSREYLVALMREFEGSVTHAAERAGMERETLHRLLKRYGLRSDEFKPGR